MKVHDLVRLYPWTNNPMILSFAEKFTNAQWNLMNLSSIPSFIQSKSIDNAFIPALFESIYLCVNHPQIHEKISRGELSFDNVIATQLELITNAAAQQSMGSPTIVLEWLGDALAKRFEREVSSYDEMDNIVQILSDENVREILSGNQAIISKLAVIPPALANLNGQDARVLLRERRLTYKQFMDLATILAKPIERVFPSWVGDVLELKKLANDFSDSQLAIIENIMNPEIKNDRELKCALLRLILLKATINGRLHINECVNIDSFKRLFITSQKEMLNTIKSHGALIGSDINTSLQQASTHSAFTNYSSINHPLIRQYLSEYRSPHVPIPSSGLARQRAFEATLRNAANQGNLWDTLVLIKEVDNINAQGLFSKKTALHSAAAYAKRTGNDLCYHVLLNAPGIDPSIKDKDNKTAAEYYTSMQDNNTNENCLIM